MTDVVVIAFCVVVALALAVIGLQAWLQRGNGADYKAALDAGAAATRAQEVAELARDQEHAARLGAESSRDELAKRLTATQAALAAAEKELTDARVHADPADALAGVLHETLVPASGTADVAAAGDGGAAAAAVPAAEAVGRAGAGPATGTGR
jgi:hypothetical protein